MDPITATAGVSIGSSVLGSLIGGVGAVQQGKAAQQAALYQSGVAQNNAALAAQYADLETQRGDREAAMSRMKTRALMGTQKAAQAASGIDVESGSPLAVRESTQALGELDAATILNNAAWKSYGYKVKGAEFGSESQMYQTAAKNAKKQSTLGFLGSLVGGASSVSDKWLKFRQSGVPGYA